MTLNQVSIPSFQENLVLKIKYITNALKFGTQSRSSLLILNMIFENCGSWPEIKSLGRFGLKIAMGSNFYEIWDFVKIEHTNYEYRTWNWWSWPKIINSGKIGPEIRSNFYEIWLSQQMEQANYEYNTRHCLERSRDCWLRMIIGCKIRLTVRTWLMNCFNTTR